MRPHSTACRGLGFSEQRRQITQQDVLGLTNSWKIRAVRSRDTAFRGLRGERNAGQAPTAQAAKLKMKGAPHDSNSRSQSMACQALRGESCAELSAQSTGCKAQAAKHRLKGTSQRSKLTPQSMACWGLRGEGSAWLSACGLQSNEAPIQLQALHTSHPVGHICLLCPCTTRDQSGPHS